MANKRLALLIITMLFLFGCTSSEQYYKDVSLSRDTAFRQWQEQKKNNAENQTSVMGQLSVQDAIKLVLKNNKQLQMVLEEKEKAKGLELKSYSAVLPTVGVNYNYMRKDEVASFDAGPAGTITMGSLNNYTTNLVVTQPLFAGGSILARLNMGQLSVLLADQTVRDVFQQVLFAAEQAYYQVVLNQHLLENSQDAVRTSQANLDDVKQKRKLGMASDFDVLRAEVELSNFKAELIQNKNKVHRSKALLMKTMGCSQYSDVNLVTGLEFIEMSVSEENAIETAFKNRPDLFTKEYDVRMQKEILSVARSYYFPYLNAYYNRMWAKPDPHRSTLNEWGDAWNAGLIANMPIFDGFSREGELIIQKSRLKQSQIDLIDTEESAVLEVTTSILSLQDASEFYESQKLNLTRAQEGLRLVEVGYREGINTQVEVLDAQSALTQARAYYYQAIYSHMMAKLYLQKAMGVLGNLNGTIGGENGIK